MAYRGLAVERRHQPSYRHHRPQEALRGEGNPSAKLTADLVRQIRINRHGKSFVQWANQLGMNVTAIRKAYYGITWGHIV